MEQRGQGIDVTAADPLQPYHLGEIPCEHGWKICHAYYSLELKIKLPYPSALSGTSPKYIVLKHPLIMQPHLFNSLYYCTTLAPFFPSHNMNGATRFV